jgi:GxxExxY protein
LGNSSYRRICSFSISSTTFDYISRYRGENVGTYFADIVVDGKIILELKAVAEFHPSMEAQIVNYLKVSKVPVGYLINFHNKKVEWKRFVNQRE